MIDQRLAFPALQRGCEQTKGRCPHLQLRQPQPQICALTCARTPSELRLGKLSHGSPGKKALLKAFQAGFLGPDGAGATQAGLCFMLLWEIRGGGRGEGGAAGSNCISQMLIDSRLQLKDTRDFRKRSSDWFYSVSLVFSS